MKSVVNIFQIAATPERVFESWVNPADLQAWWGVEKCHIDREKGGTYIIAWFVGETGIRYLNQGNIQVWQPGKRLKIANWSWLSPERSFMCGMTMDISIQQLKNSKSRLRVVQSGYHDSDDDGIWYHKAVTEAWPRVLTQLKAYLES